MLMYNLIEQSDNYSKTSRGLSQYYRDEPYSTDVSAVDNFTGNGASFEFKQIITDKTENIDTKDVKIVVPLKYLSNCLRTL